MAAYLALKSKIDGHVYAGRELIQIDEQLCKAMGVDPDPVGWYFGWMDVVGLQMATGRSFDQIRETTLDPECLSPTEFIEAEKIINWLESNFENSSYNGR